MEKLCFVFQDIGGRPPDLLSSARRFAGGIADLARAVTLHLTDTSLASGATTLGSGAVRDPAPLFDPTLYAVASIWVDNLDDLGPLLAQASSMPGTCGVHLVTESAVVDYDRMFWAAGEPSPGKTLVALFRRHPALSPESFRQRWTAHSELSKVIHPLSRYHRNHVVRTLAGDETWDGIVEERVADARDLAPDRFYIGEGSRELAARDISEFIDVAGGMKCGFMTEIIFKPPSWIARAPPGGALCH